MGRYLTTEQVCEIKRICTVACVTVDQQAQTYKADFSRIQTILDDDKPGVDA